MTCEQTRKRQNQKDEKEYLRDSCGAGRDAAESEHGGDQGNDEKNGGIVKHSVVSYDVISGCLLKLGIPV